MPINTEELPEEMPMPRLLTAMTLMGAGYGLSRLLAADTRRPRASRSWTEPEPPSPEAKAAVMVADSMQALDQRFIRYMLGNTHIERLWTGARWMEGPVWCGDLGLLVFSDIPNNRLLKYDEQSGRVSTLRQPSGYANGNARDREGRLITCTQDKRSIVRTEHDGSLTTLAATFEGKPLNGPNDIVVKSDGSIWFSDPGYGIGNFYESEHQGQTELPRAVYRLDPADGRLTVVSRDQVRPNGLAFSPDEKLLYISDTGITDGPDQPAEISAYQVNEDGTLSGRHNFFDIKRAIPAVDRTALTRARGTAGTAIGKATGFFDYPIGDGFRVDIDGNLWIGLGWAGPASDGVHVVAADGTPLGHIAMPEPIANLSFGGAKRNRLFMAGSTSLYAVYVNTAGAV
jgi:gluconolactonase